MIIRIIPMVSIYCLWPSSERQRINGWAQTRLRSSSACQSSPLLQGCICSSFMLISCVCTQITFENILQRFLFWKLLHMLICLFSSNVWWYSLLQPVILLTDYWSSQLGTIHKQLGKQWAASTSVAELPSPHFKKFDYRLHVTWLNLFVSQSLMGPKSNTSQTFHPVKASVPSLFSRQDHWQINKFQLKSLVLVLPCRFGIHIQENNLFFSSPPSDLQSSHLILINPANEDIFFESVYLFATHSIHSFP